MYSMFMCWNLFLKVEVQLRKTQFGKGVVQFVGEVHFDEGLWIGVKLNQPRGKTVYSYLNNTCISRRTLAVRIQEIKSVNSKFFW